MIANSGNAVAKLNHRFFTDYPSEAVKELELLEPEVGGKLLETQPIPLIVKILELLSPDIATEIFSRLPDTTLRTLLYESNPNLILNLLVKLEKENMDRILGLVDATLQKDYRNMMTYSEDSAGRLMDTRAHPFRDSMTVRQCVKRLRQLKFKPTRTLFLINDKNKLVSRLEMQDLALAEPLQTLKELAQPIKAFVNPMDPREEIVTKMEEFKISNLPVLDLSGNLVGVVRYDALVKAVEEEATVDIQTMFGASKDERALSKPLFSVKKRLPWLEINLVTAFLAASVVGIFESTIAKFTALAVLLPVVAGQSGNAGAQALAVTMRGLALKEISVRQWAAVVFKEVWVGLINGIAIALTTAIGVYFWSHSIGLALVIAISMVLSMVAAGFAGASVPIILTRLGQDPATASSIILTTVTDIAGFFSFLGIATLLSGML